LQVFWAIIVTILAVVCSTAFHFEVTRLLSRWLVAKPGRTQPRLLATISALVVAHVVEIGLYAGLFAVGTLGLHLGSFNTFKTMVAMDYFYFAAETYSSLGYGDIIPLGEIRLLASVEPLNGLLLLAWSGSFLFSTVHEESAIESQSARSK